MLLKIPRTRGQAGRLVRFHCLLPGWPDHLGPRVPPAPAPPTRAPPLPDLAGSLLVLAFNREWIDHLFQFLSRAGSQQLLHLAVLFGHSFDERAEQHPPLLNRRVHSLPPPPL